MLIVHNVLLIFAIVFYAIAAYSGFKALFKLRGLAEFRLAEMGGIFAAYILGLSSSAAYDRPKGDKAWGIVWLAICLSSASSMIFMALNIEYVAHNAGLSLGIKTSTIWALVHVLSSLGTILFHLAVLAAQKNNPEIFNEEPG